MLALFGAAANPGFDPRAVIAQTPAGLDVRILARFQSESDPDDEDSPVGASEVVAFGPDENRSDAKGVEPEGIATGEIDSEHFAFIGLERDSRIVIYDIGTPTEPVLVDYIDGFASGDLGPEVLEFVAAEDSPSGKALLLASYEVSGTTVAYELQSGGGEAGALAFA